MATNDGDWHARADQLAREIAATIADTQATLEALPEFEDRLNKSQTVGQFMESFGK